MNATDDTMERTKMGQEYSAPSSKGVIMSNLTISMLVALQFLWFFILGGVFYGYIDSQQSLKSIQVKLVQTEKNLTSLAAQISRVEDSMKTVNRIVPQEPSAATGINAPALQPAREIPKSIITVNQVPSPEAEIKASSVPPAREMLRQSEQYHQVNNGETLYKISKRYKISIEAIHRLNNLKQDQPILPGQKLLVTPVKH